MNNVIFHRFDNNLLFNLNGRVSAFQVIAESRWRSVAIEQDSREEVRFWTKGWAWSPYHLHRIVFETMVSIIVVITPEEQTIITHLRVCVCVCVCTCVISVLPKYYVWCTCDCA